MSLFQAEEAASWLREWGIWAILISLLLSVLISVAGLIPSIFLTTANIMVFGVVPGFLLSWLGEVAGAAVSFWLYRKGLMSIRQRRGATRWQWTDRMNRAGTKRQFSIILLGRLAPIIPSGVVTFVSAACAVPFVTYLAASAIGKLPSIALETLIGHDLLYIQENGTRLLITFILIAAIIVLLRGKKL
ncbi:VTT domain-containing protein [Paenibacillus oenotherae]|uniref:TVP38/TMEM64 family membrane protein n=1 Tax=Paenibacillus oenotherae TaxID=1435645 RepID=A0ABS7D6P8_9BACL|nr:VTT domain-containing protein [Paenibacillus oenotherae]MBW7475191.1 VTT domain-containing protein [Paenibacillus oenotherae]